MSEISNILQEIGSSGIYWTVRDISQIPANVVEPNRLLIGSARKGKFNSLVRVSDFNEFKAIFGSSDSKLENTGSFLHRQAEIALQREPIWVMNLRQFDDSQDVLGRVSLSVKSEETNSSVTQSAVRNIYDTTGYWRIDEDKLGKNADQLLNFSAIDSKNSTIFIVKTPALATETRGLRIPVSEWYAGNEDEKPEYLDDKKLISDYMISVYVFSGDLTDYENLGTDVVLGDYFDQDGLKRTFTDNNNITYNTLEALRNIPESGFVGKYSGTLIRGFIDRNENVIDFQSVFNASRDTHGLICSLSESFYDNYNETTDKPLIDLEGAGVFADVPNTSFELLSYDIDTIPTGSVIVTYDAGNGNLTNDVVKDDAGNPKDPTLITLTQLVSVAADEFSFEVHNLYPIKIGDVFEAQDKSFARVIKTEVTAVADAVTPVDTVRVYLDKKAVFTDNAGDDEIRKFVPIQEQPESYKGFYLSGYVTRDAQLPDGTLTRQKEIYSILEDVGLRAQLTNYENLRFRYIVDTYETYPSADMKSQLSRLAGENGSIRILTNAPSMRSFDNSTDPYFKDSPTATLDLAQYLPTGGNLNLNPSRIVSMPPTLDTPNNIYFYGGHFKLTERGRNIYLPVVGSVSNLFINNYDINNVYTSVAGVTNGRLPIPRGYVEMEKDFTLDERKALEDFGINPIVFKKNFGLTVNEQKTAQQRTLSSLSYIHVNEMIKEIGIEIADLLEPYRHAEFNTADTRTRIVNDIDSVLTRYSQGGAISNYEIVMDTSNNTQEVFDNQAGIINVRISPNSKLSKLITIYQVDRFNLVSFDN